MYNFGDEFTIESFRIPWLVWIQVMVMVLLLILLYCFSLLVSDLSEDKDNTTSTNKPSSSSSRLVSDDHRNPLPKHRHTTTSVSTNRLQSTQVGESIKGEMVTSTSRMRREEVVEMDASTANIYLHPCHYFRLARLAFLKCLGLDPTSENSSTPPRGKRKES